jgi:hypothetical protein
VIVCSVLVSVVCFAFDLKWSESSNSGGIAESAHIVGALRVVDFSKRPRVRFCCSITRAHRDESQKAKATGELRGTKHNPSGGESETAELLCAHPRNRGDQLCERQVGSTKQSRRLQATPTRATSSTGSAPSPSQGPRLAGAQNRNAVGENAGSTVGGP